jgi:hypothetical protein
LGHPLGCTGAKLTASILRELERRNGRYGMVTMCVGGGMGAAGIFERSVASSFELLTNIGVSGQKGTRTSHKGHMNEPQRGTKNKPQKAQKRKLDVSRSRTKADSQGWRVPDRGTHTGRDLHA